MQRLVTCSWCAESPSKHLLARQKTGTSYCIATAKSVLMRATQVYSLNGSSSLDAPHDTEESYPEQETFKSEGLDYTMDGLTGNTLNSHRLIAYAGQQGVDVQDRVVEQLFKAYFTEVLLLSR